MMVARTVPEHAGIAGLGAIDRVTAIAIAAILLVFASVSWDLYLHFWRYGRETHGPIVLLATIYLFASRWRMVEQTRTSAGTNRTAIAIAAMAFFVLLAGRSLEMIQLEVMSLPMLTASGALAIGGVAAVRKFALVIMLLVFAIPLPGSLQDTILLPAKLLLSNIATHVTYAAGLPIALSGAVIYVGYTQLQIADACSGLDTFLSLVAIGILLLFFERPSNNRVTVAFLASMLVIAFVVNCLRIISLIVITYFFGIRAEQVAHDYAAYAEIVFALLLFMGAKTVFEALLGTRTKSGVGTGLTQAAHGQ